MLPDQRTALGPFHVLVGQNATGKTTFFAALRLFSEVIERGVREAVQRAVPSFHDLCFRPGEPIALEVGLRIATGADHELVRHELVIGMDADETLGILSERLEWHTADGKKRLTVTRDADSTTALTLGTEDASTPERRALLGRDRSIWSFLPHQPNYEFTNAAREVLSQGIRMIELDAAALRSPSPPGSPTLLAVDGGNLPHVVRELQRRDPTLFQDWVEHLRTGVEALREVDVWERPEDRHLVLRARFDGVREAPIPSWLLSDGTLRLMALTLVAYAAVEGRPLLAMIEEPENGLHPLAIQAAYDALAHPPEGVQVLCATHSPIFIAHARLDDALVFRRTADGTAAIHHGREVPELASWQGGDLTDLFVTGVLS